MMTEERLMDEAKGVLHNAYSPYSGIKVGAALLTSSGNIHTGVNVENASYGLTICAERNVIPTAITQGMKKIKFLVVTGGTPEPISPCGACRQVISEFSDDETIIILANKDRKYNIWSVNDLLPYSFGPKHL